jgi:hypothetical protein
MTAQKDDEGWRKAIFSLLLRGQSIITIDNIENTLQAASLASILTAHTFQDRVLGQSLMITLPNRATWIATGNNIHVGGDLPRRCVWIKIDPKIPRPWQRDIAKFAHPDLLAWVPRERGRILASMLTIAQIWINAGMPRPMNVPILGGYEGYTKVIGGVLEAMMVTDFLGNLNEMYDTLDADTPAWDGFLTAWHEIIGDEPTTVKALIKRLENNDQLTEALPDWLALDDKKGYSHKLGNALRKREGVRFPSGLMIKKGGQFRRAVCWQCMSYGDLTHTV